RDYTLNSWVEGRQDRSGTAKAPADNEDLIWRQSESLTERNFPQFPWQFVEDVEDVFVGRFSEKLTAAFPRPAIARVDPPKAFGSEKFRQWLFARNRRHPVAQDNELLFFPRSRGRQKFCDDFVLESGSEHV